MVELEAFPVAVASTHCGTTVGTLVCPVLQLPTRQLSWCESINCRETPGLLALVGQGSTSSNCTWATTRLLSPTGCSRESNWPGVRSPAKVSNTGLVAP